MNDQRLDPIRKAVCEIVLDLTGRDVSGPDETATFYELGAESLILIELASEIQKRLQIRVPHRVIFVEVTTVRGLIEYIARELEKTAQNPVLPPQQSAEERPTDYADLQAVHELEQQIEAANKLVADMRKNLQRMPPESTLKPAPPPERIVHPAVRNKQLEGDARGQREMSSFENQRQLDYFKEFVRGYSAKTAQSKLFSANNRKWFAEPRFTTGYRHVYKELIYPIVAKRSMGSRMWDLDGNEYVDLTMGFGVQLFGHMPKFVVDALHKQLENSFQLGPETTLAAEAARLICEITGKERAFFCNSGTEAVMAALRLARASSRKSKIVMFEGSYHGTFDGVLAYRSGRNASRPVAPGIPYGFVADTIVLPYNQSESLDRIRELAPDLAAVLVEPVQTRQPAIQPREFLHSLRALTRRLGVTLIFDEVVTGFRCHPRGAQGWFEVDSDIATYGKTLGGGMPIGVVAGRACHLDCIDGGQWQFGDDSFPEKDQTVVAGTFSKHPLAMAACLAVLRRLKEAGPELQQSLTRRTTVLAGQIRDVLEAHRAPISIDHFGSQLFWSSNRSRPHAELFFPHMIAHGVYLWEGRTSFLSTAHTDQDCEHVVKAVQHSLEALERGGFLERTGDRAFAASPDHTLSVPNNGAGVVEEVPLTGTQKQVWFVGQLDGGATSRSSVSARLEGRLDVKAMQQAISDLIQRHEALRSTVSDDGSHFIVHSQGEVEAAVHDLSRLTEEDRQIEAEAFIKSESGKPFERSSKSLMRCSIVKLQDDLYQLIVVADHIIIDGYSFSVFFKELALFYAAHCEGRRLELAPAPRLHEIAMEQLPMAVSDSASSTANHLRSLPVLQLPKQKSAGEPQSYKCERYHAQFGGSILSKLRKLSLSKHSTLYVTLLSAFHILLYKLTGQSELAVGINVRQGTTGLTTSIGYRVNPMATRISIGPGTTCSEVLEAVRQSVIEANEQSDIPLSELNKDFEYRKRKQAFTVPASFNLDGRESPLLFPGLRTTITTIAPTAMVLDLAMNAIEQPDGLAIECDYKSEYFERATVAQWMDSFCRIIETMSDNPDDPIVKVLESAIHEPNAESARVDWKPIAASVPRRSYSLTAQVEGVCRDRGGAIAVGDGEAELTYSDLVEQARRIGRGLRGAGLGREEMVGVLGERSARYPGMLLGVWKGGGAYLALDPEGPAARTVGLLRQSGCRVVLSEESCRGMVQQLREGLEGLQVVWREELEREAEGEGDEGQEDEGPEEEFGEQLAYMFYTSGSTGVPKGALVEHAGVRNHVWAKVETLGLSSRDVVAQNASQSFDVSVWQMMSPFVVGGRVEVIAGTSARDGGRLLEAVAERAVTVLEVVPSQLRAMVAEDEITEIPSLRWLYVMGEVFEPALYAEWRRRYPHVGVVNGYGATECSDDVAQRTLGEEQGERLPIGRPLSNLQVYVATEDGDLARPAEVGEIYIGGVGVGRGYRGEASRTALRFVPDGWSGASGGRLYRTGDRGMWNEGGELEFVGRVDEQVKVRGHRVEPGEVEAALRSLAGVREAAVVVREERLVAFVEGDEVDSEQVRKQLRDRLPEYLIPAMVVQLAELPRTAGGKLDRPRLPATVEVERQIAEVENPQTATEELLAGIWAEVLGIGSVGRHDNFFELGGDSILTIQIAARARQQGIKISATEIFQHQTIAELAAVAREEVSIHADQSKVAGPAALTPIQARFFRMAVPDPQHWNVAVLLQTTAHLQAGLLGEALERVVLHHDSLRLRFKWDGVEWQQDHFEDAADSASFVVHNLDDLRDSELAGAIEQTCDLAQRRLNLTSGPLVAAEYFDCGPGRSSRLLLVLHHLVVDAVSWRFIVEDLQTVYRQLEQGTAPELPLKTSSYQQWGSRLLQASGSIAMRNDLDFWSDTRLRKAAKLFVDFPDGANTYGSARSAIGKLTAPETDALLRQVPQAFRLKVDEILLASVIRSLEGLADGSSIAIDIENHGREHPFADLDISRTTGWFTTIYPIVVEIPQKSTPLAAAKTVKAALEAVPNHGIAYGIAKYLGDEKSEPEICPLSQIAFNHLGTFDRIFDEAALFRPADESPGATCNAMALRPYLLEINSIVLNRQLELAFTYGRDQYSSATIESLAARCMENLRKFLAYTVYADVTSSSNDDTPSAPSNSNLEVGFTLV